MFETPKTHRSLLPIVDSPSTRDEATSALGLRFLDLPPDRPNTSYGLLGGEGESHVVRELLRELESDLRSAAHTRIALSTFAPEARRVLDEILGEGEVRGFVVTQGRAHDLRESVLPGIWRVRIRDATGAPIEDVLEVADVPEIVREACLTETSSDLDVPTEGPQGTMNALPIASEIRAKMAEPIGAYNHIVSFTNMPVTPVDMTVLERLLGAAPVVLESKGYGTCRVQLTTRRNVWSVQHKNAMGAVILDTLEIGDVPVAVLAAKEDFEDSADRIRELLGD